MVGWIEKNIWKKWMVGWIKKQMDGWMDKKNGWLDG